MCSVGESKTPDALRNASDQFIEWIRPALPAEHVLDTAQKPAEKPQAHLHADQARQDSAKPAVKRRPRFLVQAVALLASDTSEGKVGLGALGPYLKRTDPAFSPQTNGLLGLLNIVKTYDLLAPQQEQGGDWSVSLLRKVEIAPETEASLASGSGLGQHKCVRSCCIRGVLIEAFRTV